MYELEQKSVGALPFNYLSFGFSLRMRHLFTFGILFWSITGICQETKLITKKFNDSKQIYESYYVLKSDGQTKQGEYIEYFKPNEEEIKGIKRGKIKLDDFIKQKGSFKSDKKEGEWMVFFQPLTLKEKGNYENGKKVGVWLISKENGQVFERFDFDHNKKLTPLIHVYVHYPSSAREQNIEGIVTISFNTDKNCSVSNITIIKGLSKDCDKAALDAIREVAVLMKKYGEDCEEKVETLDLKFAIP